MIVDERLVTYINSLDTGNTSILDQIEQEALDSYVPIIRKEMQQFLKLLLAMKRPMRILEVGTAVGFSAILMAEYDPVPCEITTIENYEKRIPIAKENFIRAGKEKQITLLEGDAAQILPTLTESYDFIFMDAVSTGKSIHVYNFINTEVQFQPVHFFDVAGQLLQTFAVFSVRFCQWIVCIHPDHVFLTHVGDVRV